MNMVYVMTVYFNMTRLISFIKLHAIHIHLSKQYYIYIYVCRRDEKDLP